MKKLSLAVFTYFLFAHVGFSNTYVWEDYDDFSGSSLDTSKWDVGYFSGGQAAAINAGVANLTGSGYTGSDQKSVPSIWQNAASQSTGQSNSGIFVKETDIYGIEVEVSIPSSGNSQNVGFIVETHPADGSTYNGIELAWRENGLNWSYENENPSTAQILELSQEADFDTSYTLSVIHTGSRMELHINGTRVANLNSNFTPNHWLIGSFNDDGKTFNVSIDNVRVLRRSNSDSLDGTTLFLDSDDPVTLTLAFENGTITSTFEDGGEDSGTENGIQYDYIIVDQNRFSITETPHLNGDYITFDQSTGRGKLFDFKSDGQIDESGTWNFSFERFDWEDYDDFSGSSLDTSKWDVGYWGGGQTVSVVNGQAQLSGSTYSSNSPIQVPSDIAAAASGSTEGNTFLFFKEEGIYGIQADIYLPTSNNNYDVGIYLASIDTNPLGSLGVELIYKTSGPVLLFDYLDSGNEWEHQETGSMDTFHQLQITKIDGKTTHYLNGNLIKQFESSSHDEDYWTIGAFNDNGFAYSTYADNVRVLRRRLETQGYAPDSIAGKAFVYTEGSESEVTTFSSDGKVYGDKDGEWTFYTYEKLSANVGKVIYTFENEQTPMPEEEILTFTSENSGTFEWSEYSDSSMSTKTDNGSGTFSMSDTPEEAESVTVVSAPNGQPVVLQVGGGYRWNDSLDGVTLWGVGYDNEELITLTFSYSTSVVEAVLGLVDQVTNPLVTQAYTITEEGYLEHTESSGPQYFKVLSVENGKIVTIPFQDKNEASSSTDPHDTFFTTRAAAETFYNSKINYAPESLDGLTVKIHSIETSPTNQDYGIDTKYFVSPQVYSWEENQLESTTFSYVKNSASSATLTIYHDGGATKTIHDLIFSSENSAIGTWTEAEETIAYTGTTTFTIIDEEYAPDYLNGWKLESGSSGMYKFTGNSTGVFYHVDEANYSNSELSNITYTWEKIGPGIGKLYTSLDEITWLFFDTTTTGTYYWQENEQENGGSGNFSLNYYPDGHAHESMSGSSLELGDTTYLFTSDTSVTVSEGATSTVLEYAYLKNGSNNGILSIDPDNRLAIMDLTFYSHGHGLVERGGSGYFQVLSNWATKGWVWYDHYPWAYSNNMQDWFYQTLFINDDNQSDMAHYQVWNNQWNIPGELHYSGESNFSSADGHYWEDYDEFNGSELNTTKWDVAWWDGGTAPSIDQVNNRVEFNKGSSYEANLSDLMNIPNPNSESEYSYGYDASYGFAPSTIADMNVRIHEEQILPVYSDYGVDYIYYSDGLLSRYDWDEQQEVHEPYSYQRTGPNTAKITMQSTGELYVAVLNFTSQNSATGTWEEQENGATYSGSLTFDIVFSPHSVLEFVQSDDIEGIEFEMMIPNGAPDQTCIGFFAVDYNAMFNATSDEQEEGAIKFDLDLCYFNGNLTSEFNFKDQTTGQEISEKRSSTLGIFQKFQFYFSDGKIYFSLPGQEAKEYNFDRGNEIFVIRAQNEQNLDFSAYLRNVRVLRKKSYPQGWMWMDYYPWAYSHQSNSWLYFQLAKDKDGQPGMIYWDTATKDWDIYYPSLSAEQAEDKKKATELLNQE